MITSESTLWGIHAGKVGEADSLFLKKNYIALGWFQIGDLGKIEPNREAFKAKVAECYPEKKPGAIPNNAGQLFRFVHQIQNEDFVAYPAKLDRKIHIGQIKGTYEYNPNIDQNYPNLWPVKWLGSFSRTRFSQGALYEIGSALSFFQIKNYSDDFFDALNGKEVSSIPKEDSTVALVAEETEVRTKDFVLKQLAKELKGKPFESFIANIFETMGYRTRVAPEGPDGGIDVIAHKDELGLEPPIIKIQVKSTEGTVGDPEVSALFGKVSSGEYGVLVTLGIFSNQAKRFAREKSNLRLIDGDELVNIILEHYEQLDSRYKGILPLKQVYIPEQLEEAEE